MKYALGIRRQTGGETVKTVVDKSCRRNEMEHPTVFFYHAGPITHCVLGRERIVWRIKNDPAPYWCKVIFSMAEVGV